MCPLIEATCENGSKFLGIRTTDEERANTEAAEEPEASSRPPKLIQVAAPKVNRIRRQRTTMPKILRDLPSACDRRTVCNTQAYKYRWNGYKLHTDTADCGAQVSAVPPSAAVHDSRLAVPLASKAALRVTNSHGLIDAAYCTNDLHEHSGSLRPSTADQPQRERWRKSAVRSNGCRALQGANLGRAQ